MDATLFQYNKCLKQFQWSMEGERKWNLECDVIKRKRKEGKTGERKFHEISGILTESSVEMRWGDGIWHWKGENWGNIVVNIRETVIYGHYGWGTFIGTRNFPMAEMYAINFASSKIWQFRKLPRLYLLTHTSVLGVIFRHPHWADHPIYSM